MPVLGTGSRLRLEAGPGAAAVGGVGAVLRAAPADAAIIEGLDWAKSMSVLLITSGFFSTRPGPAKKGPRPTSRMTTPSAAPAAD
jgi:hypothetical protein